MFSCHSHPIVDRISFRCFGMSCFICIALPFVDISLIFLLWPVFSGLFPQVVLLFSPMLPVPSSPRLFKRLSSSFGLVFVGFFICYSSLISHPGFCCFFRSLFVVLCYVVVYVSEKRAANIRWMTTGSPMLAIRRAPADHNTQSCCLGPTLCNIVIWHFYHGWYK